MEEVTSKGSEIIKKAKQDFRINIITILRDIAFIKKENFRAFY